MKLIRFIYNNGFPMLIIVIGPFTMLYGVTPYSKNRKRKLVALVRKKNG